MATALRFHIPYQRAASLLAWALTKIFRES